MDNCFYCGGSHYASACPSKRLSEISKSSKQMQQIDYQSIEQLNKLASEQNKLYSALRESNETITRRLEDIHTSIEDMSSQISNAIYELTDFFTWAHAETMWKMEQQIHLLTGIHDMLKNPRATHANELLKMGEESLKGGMIEESLRLGCYICRNFLIKNSCNFCYKLTCIIKSHSSFRLYRFSNHGANKIVNILHIIHFRSCLNIF